MDDKFGVWIDGDGGEGRMTNSGKSLFSKLGQFAQEAEEFPNGLHHKYPSTVTQSTRGEKRIFFKKSFPRWQYTEKSYKNLYLSHSEDQESLFENTNVPH